MTFSFWCSSRTDLISPCRATPVSQELNRSDCSRTGYAVIAPAVILERFWRVCTHIWDFFTFPVLWQIGLIGFYLHKNKGSSVTLSHCFIYWHQAAESRLLYSTEDFRAQSYWMFMHLEVGSGTFWVVPQHSASLHIEHMFTAMLRGMKTQWCFVSAASLEDGVHRLPPFSK